MAIKTSYKKLFEVKCLHHYFLNVGTSHFEDIGPAEQIKRMSKYDINDFVEFVPTMETKRILKGYRMKALQTATGIFIVVPVSKSDPAKPAFPPVTGSLTFALFTKGFKFPNYSKFTIETSISFSR